jgi:SAM-dependent methyltransferase
MIPECVAELRHSWPCCHLPWVVVADSEYLLTNAHDETVSRFDALAEAFDASTIEHLSRVGVAPGWRCLELGAGGGSIASWLATQVGPDGRVLATDIDISRVQPDARPQLEVRRHDLVSEELPLGPWELIHERLVLQHVPAREQVLDRIVAALAPGGWVVLEDFDTAEVRTTDRDGPDHDLIARVALAFNRLLAARGGVSSFAANARRELMNRGLVDIGSSGHVSIASGGTGFARAVAANTAQVRDQLEADGLTPAELDDFLEIVDDPATLIGSPVLISTWGRLTG